MTTSTEHGSARRTTVARHPRLSHERAMQLAATEYERSLELLRSLTDDEWQLPTCCPGWTVAQMTGHNVGMTAMYASLREQLRQTRAAKRAGGMFLDALTGLQVARHGDLPPAQLIAEMARLAPKGLRGRRRMPALVRRRGMGAQPVDGKEQTEPWTVGYLLDVIATRDLWMHRSDVCVATGRQMQLSAEHDGAIVADVVEEWAERHGQPYQLTLTGPAGGTWAPGAPQSAERLELDAIEFCRILSGRGAGSGLLATRVPF
jgi:uncharacterized protein (TIGR03083 family)